MHREATRTSVATIYTGRSFTHVSNLDQKLDQKLIGRRRVIRTLDPLTPRQVRYQAALYAEV